jgi:hypothetical protein
MRAKLLVLIVLLGVSVFSFDFPPGPARPSIPAKPQSVSPPSGKILAISSSSNLAAAEPPVPAGEERHVHVLNGFRRWAESYVTAGPDEKTAIIAEGAKLATERRDILAALIESDPAEALRQAVPMRLRQELPPEIAALLEERVSGRGEYNVLATLPLPGAEKTVRPIKRFASLSGQTYQAFVYGRRLSQTSRTNIPLYGVAIDGKLAVHEDPVRPLEPGETPDPQLPVGNRDEICGISGLPSGRAAAAQVGNEIFYFCHSSHIAAYNEQTIKREDAAGPGALTAWTSGIKTVLFMRLNFPDDPEESISMADAVSMMNSASNWFDEVSYHITALNATVTPLLTMPNPKSWYQNSDPFLLLRDGRNVAASNGFNTVNFDLDCVHHKYIFSGANGAAYLGSKGAWLQSGPDVGILCHEFGHNYGLWHANYWNATDDTIIGPGSHEEYGNIFDTMGSSATAGPCHFNACHKNLLGWLPDANVATVTNSGLYRIYAFDTPTLISNRFYALKVKKDDRDYWAELRSGFNQWVQNGIMLNWSPWAQSDGGTHLLDTTPESPYLKNDCPVVAGRTFSDPFAGIHLTPVRVNNDTVPRSLDIVVNLGKFPENNPPIVSLSASATTVGTNVPVTFTATASDPDGDPLAYYWDFGEVFAAFGTNGPVAVKSWSDGVYVVRCVVSDMKGGTASATVLVTVGSPPWYYARGRVLNGSTPLEGVRVSASGYNGYSDANGDYIVIGLSAGSCSLSAIKAGWVFAPSNFSNPVTVGPSVSNLNFTATPVPYHLSGQVNYIGAIAGATVTLGGAGTNSMVTDVSGYFNFSNVHAGVYYSLTATKPNYELQPAGWTNPIALEWQDASGKNFQRPYYRLSGIVSNLPWNPTVSISDPDSFANTTPLDGGHWSYNLPVPRGQWNLVAASPGYTISPANFTNPIVITNLTPDQPLSFNFHTTAGNTYVISGSISESGRPLPKARINAGSFSGFSDTLGNYVLPGLSNGNYSISAALSEYAFNPARRVVTISGGDWPGQDFTARLIFQLTQMRATNAGFAFRLSGGSNRVFRIESSTNLASWATLATVTNATGQLDFLDAPSANPRRFYRAAVLP